ncbi:MAG TPA: ATP-dependent DNA helicase RecG [bacterium]|nr:ATP-dependent DNA helicase RecG [bacterium]
MNSLILETPVQYVKGIGPKRAALLARAGVRTVEDLLHYYPRRYLDRSRVVPIRSLAAGDQVTVVGTVLSREVRRGRRNRLIVSVGDGTGILQCVWFQGISYLSDVFNNGETVAFSGKVTVYRGPQMVHPEYDRLSEADENNPLNTGGIIPLYPSTEGLRRVGLDSRGFRRILGAVLTGVEGNIHEILPKRIIERCRLVSIGQALSQIHFPNDEDSLQAAQRRLKFDELFFLQLVLAHQKMSRSQEQGIAFDQPKPLTRRFLSGLSFHLTGSQQRVIDEIEADMAAPRRMNRLLQGDVGSGKTVVAMAALLGAIDHGYQAALMAPTEILAEQHYMTLREWADDLGVRIALLKGGQKSGERQTVLEDLSRGTVQLIIGTHALVQEKVIFFCLGVVVIDEQHRFGVLQRAKLRLKGWKPDVLVMTATPIPRTLALTLYGDLDVSVLDEMPSGRIPVRTYWRTHDRREKVYAFLHEEVLKGRQAYVIFPLVEESEKLDLAAATEGYQALTVHFPDLRIALLHGRMKSEEKEETMKAFKAGLVQVLVSTTVVEVGVDVPNATIMVIEHAERFGLTQLHQLRGRVGRGTHAASCILLSYGRLTDDAVRRLDTMEKNHDGLRIAEIDLEIRGPGELSGTRQHGDLGLRIANLITDGKLLELARREAFDLTNSDPKLRRQEHVKTREALMKRSKHQYGLLQVG